IVVLAKKDLKMLWSKAIPSWNVGPVKLFENSFSDIRVDSSKLVFISNAGEFQIKPDSGVLLKTPNPINPQSISN
ncbi:MAG: hypothetical protein KDD45_07105, partial [Bdellovibrionales bacterium]|nr:hypothetical protein [Bdellovibrionales bacterium]